VSARETLDLAIQAAKQIVQSHRANAEKYPADRDYWLAVAAGAEGVVRAMEELPDTIAHDVVDSVPAESVDVGATLLEVRASSIAGRSVHVWTGVSGEDLRLDPAAARRLGAALIRAAGTR
jgi:hypothetical protein